MTPRWALLLLHVLVCALVLAGCTSDPGPRGKNRRDLGTFTGNEDALDGLPLLALKTDPGINLDGYTPSDIAFAGRHYAATAAKYRGATSATYPKKSFTLKFTERDPLDDEGTGFTETRKVVLISSFDDNSYVRQALALQLWNHMDPEHLQVRTAFVSVVLNGDYEGIYLMADHVDDDLMERLGLWEDGNLYKARYRTATFAVKTGEGEARSPHTGFTKEEGRGAGDEEDEAADHDHDEDAEDERPAPDPHDDDGVFADLDGFAGWLEQADETELAANLGAHLDVRDYIDWWIFATLIDASDTVNKNTHHYHDPRPAEPPHVFRFLPWDFNASFGQDWRTKRRAASEGFGRYDGANRIFVRLTGSAHFAPQLRARYRALSPDGLSLTWVQAWVDGARAQIERAARQDEKAWRDAHRDFFGDGRQEFTDYSAENGYLDEWIGERWVYMSEQVGEP